MRRIKSAKLRLYTGYAEGKHFESEAERRERGSKQEKERYAEGRRYGETDRVGRGETEETRGRRRGKGERAAGGRAGGREKNRLTERKRAVGGVRQGERGERVRGSDEQEAGSAPSQHQHATAARSPPAQARRRDTMITNRTSRHQSTCIV
eukprot:2399501-Pleurochrysis_carterae.AAC.2